MEIRQYADVNKEKWDCFVNANSSGYAYHLYDVIALDRWESDQNRAFCIVDGKNDEILLLSMLHLEECFDGNESYYKLHSRWGMVVKDGLTKKQYKKVAHKYKEYIDSIFDEYNVRVMASELPPLSLENQPGKINGINKLMFFGFKPGIRYTYVVPMDGTEDDMMARCEQTTRQAIRKMKRNRDYKVVEAQPTLKDCKVYENLHAETYTRTGSPSAIIYHEYQENIFLKLIPQGISRVFFLKNQVTGEIVAATVIIIYKNTAYYWWGASKNGVIDGANKYLLWESMMEVYRSFKEKNDNGKFYFECGGAYPYARSGKGKGLNDYKKHFGGVLHPIYIGEYVRN